MPRQMSLILTFVFCSLMIACGVTSTGNSPAGATTTVSGSPFPSTPIARGTTFPSTSTVGGTPAAEGQVTITVQQTSLQRRDIAAVIQNNNATAIMVADHEANCTILTLQEQVGGQWANRAPCASSSALQLVSIAAGASLTVDVGTKDLATGSAWSAGTYRLQMQFVLKTTSAPGPAERLYAVNSATFSIQ